MESQPTDSYLVAQRLHAGGLPERHRRAAYSQIPPGDLHTDCRGAFVYLNTNKVQFQL